MRHGNVKSLVCVVTTAMLATWVTAASAQGPRETEVKVLGGAARFSQPMRSVSDLRAMVNTNRNQISSVLALAGLGQLSTQVLDTLTYGNLSDVTVQPDTHLEWMAMKRSGTPSIVRNVRWVGKQSFDAYQFSVDNAGYTYTFVVPKVCDNRHHAARGRSGASRRVFRLACHWIHRLVFLRRRTSGSGEQHQRQPDVRWTNRQNVWALGR